MSSPSPLLEEPQAIRMVFQRLCREGTHLFVGWGSRRGIFPLLAETEGRLSLALSEAEWTQWGLRPGAHLKAQFQDRGRQMDCTLEVAGMDSLDGIPCCVLEAPRLLRLLDAWRFADLIPEKPLRATFTTPGHDIVEARVRSLGEEGLLLRCHEGIQTDTLREGLPTTAELMLPEGPRLLLQCRVVQIKEGLVGLLVLPGTQAQALKSYRGWVLDGLLHRLQRDREAFDPSGVRAERMLLPGRQARQLGLPRLLVDRHPLVMVVEEGDALARRIAGTLGRRFGVGVLDYLTGPVQPLLQGEGGEWGWASLLLVHHRQRFESGMDLIRRLVDEEGCPLPILAAGTEEDMELKRQRALDCGAREYVPVEPWHVLGLKLALERHLPGGGGAPAQ